MKKSKIVKTDGIELIDGKSNYKMVEVINILKY